MSRIMSLVVTQHVATTAPLVVVHNNSGSCVVRFKNRTGASSES